MEGQPPSYAPHAHAQSVSGQGQPQGQPIYVQPLAAAPQYVPQAQYTTDGQPIYQQPMPAQPQPGQYVTDAQGQPVYGHPGGQQMMYVAQPVQGGQWAQPMQVVGIPAVGAGAGGAHVNINGVAQPQYLGFSDGVFDCFDECTTCLLSYFVAPLRFAWTVERASLMDFLPAFILYGIPFFALIVLLIIDYLTPWIFVGVIACRVVLIFVGTIYRTQIREKYNLVGSSMEDCCLHMWCACCAISQEARHVDRVIGRIPHSYRYQNISSNEAHVV